MDADSSNTARTIATAQARWTAAGPDAVDDSGDNAFLQLVFEQHARNHRLWHQEDLARAPDADDATIAAVKRRIDKLNQERNDRIEQLDEAILVQLPTMSEDLLDRPWNSETPGSCIDRLSILALKVHYMGQQVTREDVDDEHRANCQARHDMLVQQREDLTIALQELLDDLHHGRKRMKLYKQHKMYNDPKLNPAIYGAGGGAK